MHIVLFDDAARHRLLPFTHTRPVADIRCGILTMRERWELQSESVTTSWTETYLRELFPLSTASDVLFINGALFADSEITQACLNLEPGAALVAGNRFLAARFTDFPEVNSDDLEACFKALSSKPYNAEVRLLSHVWDIFSENSNAIKLDYQLITMRRESAPIPDHVIVSGGSELFIEPGAVVCPCFINLEAGPVYIGREAQVMEGCMLRGPIALCDHAVLKMGAKVYGATTVGPGSKVGGEVNNVVFFANSNKGHDGFLGNAVIGEWCNLGADTNCSNLKNNYGEVKIWDEYLQKSVATGLQFCGLMMGDHSKSGINTMFNTGTVAGVSCNIYGSGFPGKFIPSFSWGGSEGMIDFAFDKAMEVASRMMARRGVELTEKAVKMYRHLHEQTASQRALFNRD